MIKNKEIETLKNKINKFYDLEEKYDSIFKISFFCIFINVIIAYITQNYYGRDSIFFTIIGALCIINVIITAIIGFIHGYRKRICPRCEIEMVRFIEDGFVKFKCNRCGIKISTSASTASH